MLIFPTGGNSHNWFGAQNEERIGHQAMSDEELQGFIQIDEVEVDGDLPGPADIEVSEEIVDEVIDDEVEVEVSCEEGEEVCDDPVVEIVEEIKEDLDELVELIVTEGDDGAFEISDEEPLDSITDSVEVDIEEEIGDVLFSIVNLSRFLKISSENALRKTNKKFINRFKKIEEELKKRKQPIEDASLAEMDEIWEKVKLAD